MDPIPPPGYFKLFGAILPFKLPELPAIANPPPPPLQINPPQASGAKRRRSAAKRPRKPVPVPPQPLPQRYRDFLDRIGGSNPTHIYSRTLCHSDVAQQLNRLNFRRTQLLVPFLADGELEFIQGKDADNRPNKLSVKVIDPGLVMRTMSLAMWNFRRGQNRSWWCALCGNWIEIVRASGLVEGNAIQVWSFRINGQLGFIIHEVASPNPELSISNGDNSIVFDGSSSSGGRNNGGHQGGDPGCSSSAIACAH